MTKILKVTMLAALFITLSLGVGGVQAATVQTINDGLQTFGGPYVNPGGLGQTLIYSYYNARTGQYSKLFYPR